MSTLPDDPRIAVRLRPIGSSFPLGLSGLVAASLVLSGLELGWIASSERSTVGVMVLCTGAALQAVASLLAFAARDGAAGSAMGTLAAGWTASGLVLILSPSSSTSPALGMLLFALGGLLVLYAGAVGISKTVPACAVGLAALRFLAAGVYETSAATGWKHVSGVIGLAVVAVGAYAAVAQELEAAASRPVLPIGRRPTLNDPAREPGVRPNL